MPRLTRAKEVWKDKGLLPLLGAVAGYSGKTAEDVFLLIEDEFSSNATIPFRDRLYAWRRGFSTESFVMFNLEKNDHNEYLSNVEHRFGAAKVNKHTGGILSDKAAFHHTFSQFEEHLPTQYGLVLDGEYKPTTNETLFDGYLTDCVIKPIIGAEGNGVKIIRQSDGGPLWNGERTSEEEIADRIKTLDDNIVTEFVEQAEYATEIYPKTTNTLRIITMIDPKSGDPFIATAAHRFGTTASEPVDNWSRGGVCADVDIESGTLGDVAVYPNKEQVIFRDKHPETGTEINGVKMPNWDMMTETLLEMCRHIPHIPYVGWDVVLTDDGFKVIEANSKPGINTSQVHGGLLKHERVKRFFNHS